jgi:hypothetical protein
MHVSAKQSEIDSQNIRYMNKIKEYVIESDCLCSDTVGRLCKINDNLFTVVWGDENNFDYFYFLSFNKSSYEKPIELSHNIDIEACYFMDPDLILESHVVAYKQNYIAIRINNYVDEKQGYIFYNEISLPFNHRFDYEEIKSYILSFQKINNEYICEIKVFLESKLDILHIDYFNINLSLNITTNKIINISEKNSDHKILFFF